MAMKTYHVCLSYDGPLIPTGTIELGHIITKISEPCTSLNKDDRVDISEDKVQSSDMNNYMMETKTNSIRKLELGFSSFWHSVEISSDINYKYQFDLIETSFFDPTQEYYDESVSLPAVQSYLKASKYKLPLYMITGLMIGRGGKLWKNISNVRKIRDKPIASLERSGETWLSGTSFVFAIRLKKLICSKDGKIKNFDYNKGAMIG